MNNAQAALIAAATICAGYKNEDLLFMRAEKYKQWLDGQDTLAGRRQLAGNIWEDEKDG